MCNSTEYKIRGGLRFIATRIECKTWERRQTRSLASHLLMQCFAPCTTWLLKAQHGFHLLFYTSFGLLTTVQCAKRVNYSALTKYRAIKETLQSLTSRITSSLQCALWRLFQLRHPPSRRSLTQWQLPLSPSSTVQQPFCIHFDSCAG